MALETQRTLPQLKAECLQKGIEVVIEGKKEHKEDYVKALRNYWLNKYYGSPEKAPWALKFMLNEIDCPMLCKRFKQCKPEVQKRMLESDEYIAEEKWDGSRALILFDASTQSFDFYSRNNSVKDFLPQSYKDTVLVTSKGFTYPKNFVLDCEVISTNPNISTVMGKRGVVCATQLQATTALLALNPEDSKALQRKDPLKFIIFDCLYDGESLINKPWKERHPHAEKLASLLKQSGFTCDINPVVRENKLEFYSDLIEQGKEGCFASFTKVLMGDGSLKKIKDVCVGDVVKSYDLSLNEVVNKKVTRVFFNGKKPLSEWHTVYHGKSLGKRGLHQNFYQGSRILCTKNHKFFDGESFTENSELSFCYEYSPIFTNFGIQALYGLMLSDGTYPISSRSGSICQKLNSPFTDYLIQQLRYCGKVKHFTSGKGSEIASILIERRYLYPFDGLITGEGNSIKNLDFSGVINSLNEVGLAYFFMGDGYGSDKSISLGMYSYSDKEVNCMIDKLSSYNITCQKKIDSRVKDNGSNSRVHLILNKENSKKFSLLISKYIHPSMKYKISNFVESEEFYDKPFMKLGLLKRNLEKCNWIWNKKTQSGYKNYISAYDLEVEDTHSYFAEGVLVHNCVFKRVEAPYHGCTSRTDDQVKLKRTVAEGLNKDLDAWVTGFIPSTQDKGWSNYIGALVFSCKVQMKDGTIKDHVIGVCSGIPFELRKAATIYIDDKPSLNPDFLGRVATLSGQNISARKLALTHAVIQCWRPDKDPDGCETLTEEELLSLVF